MISEIFGSYVGRPYNRFLFFDDFNCQDFRTDKEGSYMYFNQRLKCDGELRDGQNDKIFFMYIFNWNNCPNVYI